MDHEDLDVYRTALDFVSFVQELLKRMPGGRRGIDDQLMRAATSMPLNIAEGAGEFSAKDKARFYRIARRSATECAAALDVCVRIGLAREESVQQGRCLLRRIVAMLTKMVLGLDTTRHTASRVTDSPSGNIKEAASVQSLPPGPRAPNP
jgi:four helix bundle protein